MAAMEHLTRVYELVLAEAAYSGAGHASPQVAERQRMWQAVTHHRAMRGLPELPVHVVEDIEHRTAGAVDRWTVYASELAAATLGVAV